MQEKGVEQYVFTHRGKTTEPVLAHLKMGTFFKYVITSQSGFPRKPDPAAIDYLVERFQLDKGNTFYIGDRSLDMQCAKNAGVSGILFLPPDALGEASGIESFVVHDLMEIADLVK